MLTLREQENRRLANLAWVRSVVVDCLREHLITDYRPGEVWYNLNEYPALPLRKPDAYDAALLAEHRSHGIEVVKLHNEWNDWLGLCGGDMFSASDPEGFDAFCKMAHTQGLKVHVYFSACYMDDHYPPLRKEWATGMRLEEVYWYMNMCSVRNADFRGHVLERVAGLLDRYPVDGLYDDVGYANPFPFKPAYLKGGQPNPADLWEAFHETPDQHAALEDYLGRLHGLLKQKRPAGMMTLHFESNRRPPIKSKPYDRLYVGEGVGSLSDLCLKTKRYEPYTFLIPDVHLGEMGPRAVYAGGLPYLQFPVLYDGYPLTGERGFAKGVTYVEGDHWGRQLKKISEIRSQGGPATYSWWDSVPGKPEAKPTYYHFLSLWKQVAKEGTRAFLEVGCQAWKEAGGDLLWAKKSQSLVQSFFANEDLYLVAANHGQTNCQAALHMAAVDAESGAALGKGEEFSIPAQDLKILRLIPDSGKFDKHPNRRKAHA